MYKADAHTFKRTFLDNGSEIIDKTHYSLLFNPLTVRWVFLLGCEISLQTRQEEC